MYFFCRKIERDILVLSLMSSTFIEFVFIDGGVRVEKKETIFFESYRRCQRMQLALTQLTSLCSPQKARTKGQVTATFTHMHLIQRPALFIAELCAFTHILADSENREPQHAWHSSYVQ